MAFITSYAQLNKNIILILVIIIMVLVEIFLNNLLVMNEQNFSQPIVSIVLFQQHGEQEKLETV
ncbi:hypothetical protein [Spiroplasma ixodetis]|uniref:Uncharacterized protein n=1 Tax=Spiroplasma ixodetis TaxID=2141 RepID=A0ABM8BVX0_9MOLU|nr:hypothetical protein [Spiroplasma ixodetis]BDT04029.1 hypothetical protein SHM_16750 [Spiroplasma ixodetis]BDT05054.1 hypothetical protein SHM_27000 [Spiroplasma ixodetis]